MSTDDTTPDPAVDGDETLSADDQTTVDDPTGEDSRAELGDDATDVDAPDESVEVDAPEADAGEVDAPEGDPGEVDASDGDAEDDGEADETASPVDDDGAAEDDAPSVPPRAAVVLSLIAVAAVVVGLAFALINGRTPATYVLDGEAVSRAEAAETLDGLQPGVSDVVLEPENASPEELQQVRELLNFEIVYGLLNKAADERGVEVTDDEIIDSIRERFAQDAPDDEVLATAAAATGATEDRLRREAEANLIYEGLLATAELDDPTDAEVEAAFESGEFADLSAEGLNIISAPTQEEADDAFARLEDGEDFGAVAASLDPSYAGPQRPFDPTFLPPVLADSVADLQPGEYTEPIELTEDIGEGFVILQIVEAPSLDEVAPTISGALSQQAEGQFLQDLLTQTEEASDITVDPIFGEWVNGQGLVPPEASGLGAPVPGEDQ